jgi:hypothetical protein
VFHSESNGNLHTNSFTHKKTKSVAILIISDVLPLDEHVSHTNTTCVSKYCYQSVYCCLIQYFLVRISIAKCNTNRSQRKNCKVFFENKLTFAHAQLV